MAKRAIRRWAVRFADVEPDLATFADRDLERYIAGRERLAEPRHAEGY